MDSHYDDFEFIAPPLMGIQILSILVWIFFAIFRVLDPNFWIYTTSMFIVGAISCYQMFYIKQNDLYFQTTGIVFFLVAWLGMFVLIPNHVINIPNISFSLS